MRGVYFKCFGKELFYTVSNGINHLTWRDTFTPENKDVVKYLRKNGFASSAHIWQALDSIPKKISRGSLLKFVSCFVNHGAPVVIEINGGNGSGKGEYVQDKWENNTPADFYVEEIEKHLKVMNVVNNKINAKRVW